MGSILRRSSAPRSRRDLVLLLSEDSLAIKIENVSVSVSKYFELP